MLYVYSVNNLYKYLALSQVLSSHMPRVRGTKHYLCFDTKEAKVMLSLYPMPLKNKGRVEIQIALFLTLALDGDE